MNKKIAIGGLTLAVIGLLSFQALKTTELNTLSASLRTSLSTAFAGYSEDVEETGKVVSLEINAAQTETEIIPGYTTDVWTYNGTVPGPEIRIQKGDTLEITLNNNLPQSTTIHWHGVRLDNEMDGVPGITQDPIAPGKTFVYRFTPKDAGTFWFHPHVRGSEQLEKGLYGVLIVEDPGEPTYDQDVVWALDDWRLSDDASISANFSNMHDIIHDGRWGNIITINGKTETKLNAQSGEIIRLRLVNTANARVFTPDFGDLSPIVIAVDGMLVKEPFTYKPMALSPGNRLDVIIDTSKTEQKTIQVTDTFARQTNELGSIVIEGESEAPKMVEFPQNVQVPTWNTELAEVLPDYTYNLALTRMGMMNASWTINGKVFGKDQPVIFDKDKVTIVRFQNDSGNLHPMHLHGQFFQVIRRNGEPANEHYFRDTVLLSAQETVDVAMMPRDKGQWALHCHIQEHAEAGMMTSIIVE